VDEIIVVDTGSDDRTVEIAEEYGCRVYHHAWEGDFSKARNYSLSYATSDWILVMDPDEKLEREDIPKIKQALSRTDIDVVFVAIMNETPVGWTKHYSQRFFRRGIAEYRGIVHNQLFYEGRELRTEIVIYHWGYNLSPEQMEKKFLRTKALLLKQLEEDPTDPFAYMNYVRLLKSQKKYEETRDAGLKALELTEKRIIPPIRQMIVYDTVCALIELGEYQTAEEMAREICNEFPDNLDMCYGLGHALIKQRRYQEAIVVYQQFLKIQKTAHEKPKHSMLIVDTYTLDHRVWAIIADCYFELGAHEQGLDAALQAIALMPEMGLYKITAARHLMELERVGEAKVLVAEIEQSENVDETVFLKFAALCSQYPVLGVGHEVLKRGVERFPQSIELLNYFANAMVKMENGLTQAAWAWEQVIALDPRHEPANVGLVKAALLQHNDVKLKEFEARQKTLTLDAHAYKGIAQVAIQQHQLAFAVEMLSRAVALNPNDLQALVDLSACYMEMENYQSALHGLKSVLARDSANRQALQQMAVLRERLSSK